MRKRLWRQTSFSKAIRSPSALFNYSNTRQMAIGTTHIDVFLIALMADQCSFTLAVRLCGKEHAANHLTTVSR